MTDKAYAVPLHELLAHVPRGARLEITDPDGMGTRFIPVGRYCHEASEALRARLATCDRCGKVNPAELHTCTPPQREWVGLTDEEMMQSYVALKSVAGFYSLEKYARDIEAKLKEKNNAD